MRVEDRVDLESLRKRACQLRGAKEDYDPLLERIGNSSFALLGEASHGTHEFYRHRAEITKRLITEKGFTAICIEGDWPDAYRVNRFVRGESCFSEAVEALSGLVWAHNSHLGDARSTEMGRRGEWNIGQLTRERYGRETVLVGFTTYTGTVTAASDWDRPAERKRVQQHYRRATNRSFMVWGHRTFCSLSPTGPLLSSKSPSPYLNERSGWFICPKPSASATTSMPSSPANSIQFFILT